MKKLQLSPKVQDIIVGILLTISVLSLIWISAFFV